jgi:hypothetical protein
MLGSLSQEDYEFDINLCYIATCLKKPDDLPCQILKYLKTLLNTSLHGANHTHQRKYKCVEKDQNIFEI